jgi:hypothetical protein
VTGLIHFKLTYIVVQIVVDTTCFPYNAYKKYLKDPECYDQRSEKKMKYGTKLKLRREFPVSISKVVLLLLTTIYYYYFL